MSASVSMDVLDSIKHRINTLNSSCLHVEKQAARFFYYEARRFIGWLAGMSNLSVERCAAIVAVMSPRSNWEGNQLDAISICLGADASRSLCAGFQAMPRDVGRARQIADGEEVSSVLRGVKVNAFYRNLLQPAEDVGVPIDRHLYRAMHGHELTEYEITSRLRSEGEYERCEDMLSEIAHTLRLRPIELANRLWYVMRRLSKSKGQHSLPTANLQWRPLYPGGEYVLRMNRRSLPELTLQPHCTWRPWLEETPFTLPRFGNETIDTRGRVKVYLGRDHKYANKSGSQYRYRLAVAYSIGRLPRTDEHVHHTGRNDDPAQLELMLAEYHGRMHAYATSLAGYNKGGKVGFIEHTDQADIGRTFPWPRFGPVLGSAARQMQLADSGK